MIQSWKLGLATLVMSSAIAWANCADAQIIPDNTLGNENSTVTSTGSVDAINGGTTRGANLLHSFQEFNVGEGRSAYFANPAPIENILSRVTGGNPSQILGKLGVLGNANLFLINPNGIIFGRNASLDVRGSFVGTTANGIGLTNGDIFSANPQAPLPTGLLNVNPNAFFFNQLKAQKIVNRSTAISSGLQVPQGRSLLLVGGDVRLEGGKIFASGGRVELGSVAGLGTVGLNVSGNNLSLNFPANVERAEVSFTDGAEVNVASGGGGSIAVNAKNIEVLGKSSLRAGIGLFKGVDGAQAGDVTLNATETVRVENSSIYNAALGNGNSGKLQVDTGNLIIRDGVLATLTISQGSGGELIVNAKDLMELTGSPTSNGTISINIPVEALGSYRDVSVNLPIGLFSLSINARNLLNPQNISNVPLNLENFLPKASGKAGNINVETGRLIVSDGAVVLAGTTSEGSAGDLTVKADLIELSGISANDSSIGIRTLSFENRIPSGLRSGTTGFGLGGNLTIETGRLIARDGAWVGTNTAGEKPAGELTVNATESIELSGTSFANGFPTFLANGTRGGGNAKSLTINTKQLKVSDGAIVSSGTSGSGQGGELMINASESVELIGTSKQPVSARVLQELLGASGISLSEIVGEEPFLSGVITGSLGGEGNAGALTINTGRLLIRDGAQASVFTVGAGNAGSLTVRASSIELIGSQQSSDPNDISGQSLLTTAVGAGSTGKGGDIDITTKTLLVEQGAAISVSSNGLTDAGSLRLKADSIALDEGNLKATTASGRGGDMNIQVQDLLFMRNVSNIATSAAGNGSGGNITINAPFVIAVPNQNSDIIADAERGSGGRISINATGILGLEYREIPTETTSDINASSDFGIDGTVEINTLDIDPSSGLVELPTVPVDTQVAQTCQPSRNQAQSEFVVTGRGGLPPSPDETLSSDAVQVDWVTLNPKVERNQDVSTNITTQTQNSIVEATGLTIAHNGDILLTASATTTLPSNSKQTLANCHAN